MTARPFRAGEACGTVPSGNGGEGSGLREERFVVIGSNSFSGSDFIDLVLSESHTRVWGVSRSPEPHPVFLPYRRHGPDRFRFHRLDLNADLDRIMSLIDEVRPDYVVNFAAQSEVAPSWDVPLQYYRTNVVAIVALAESLRRRPSLHRYVHISTAEVYGTCAGRVREDAPLNPSTPYAASKAAADLFLLTLARQYRFPAVLIRATNVYGARQQLHKIIPRTVVYPRLDRKIELHAGGAAVKSYIHIRDVSRGELLACRAGAGGEVYHLSPESGIRIRDLVRRICELRGVPFDTVSREAPERPGQDAAYLLDASKARAAFGWRPSVPLEEGLSQVFDWVDSNWDVIRTLPLEYAYVG